LLIGRFCGKLFINSNCGLWGSWRCQIENGKWKIENYGVRFADDLNHLRQQIPQFSTFNFQFSIRSSERQTETGKEKNRRCFHAAPVLLIQK
jgi:hypothetical protein